MLPLTTTSAIAVFSTKANVDGERFALAEAQCPLGVKFHSCGIVGDDGNY